jgi:hypothetical protein
MLLTALRQVLLTALPLVLLTALRLVPLTALRLVLLTALRQVPLTALRQVPLTALRLVPLTALRLVLLTAQTFPTPRSGGYVVALVARRRSPHPTLSADTFLPVIGQRAPSTTTMALRLVLRQWLEVRLRLAVRLRLRLAVPMQLLRVAAQVAEGPAAWCVDQNRDGVAKRCSPTEPGGLCRTAEGDWPELHGGGKPGKT